MSKHQEKAAKPAAETTKVELAGTAKLGGFAAFNLKDGTQKTVESVIRDSFAMAQCSVDEWNQLNDEGREMYINEVVSNLVIVDAVRQVEVKVTISEDDTPPKPVADASAVVPIQNSESASDVKLVNATSGAELGNEKQSADSAEQPSTSQATFAKLAEDTVEDPKPKEGVSAEAIAPTTGENTSQETVELAMKKGLSVGDVINVDVIGIGMGKGNGSLPQSLQAPATIVYTLIDSANDFLAEAQRFLNRVEQENTVESKRLHEATRHIGSAVYHLNQVLTPTT